MRPSALGRPLGALCWRCWRFLQLRSTLDGSFGSLGGDNWPPARSSIQRLGPSAHWAGLDLWSPGGSVHLSQLASHMVEEPHWLRWDVSSLVLNVCVWRQSLRYRWPGHRSKLPSSTTCPDLWLLSQPISMLLRQLSEYLRYQRLKNQILVSLRLFGFWPGSYFDLLCLFLIHCLD